MLPASTVSLSRRTPHRDLGLSGAALNLPASVHSEKPADCARNEKAIKMNMAYSAFASAIVHRTIFRCRFFDVPDIGARPLVIEGAGGLMVPLNCGALAPASSSGSGFPSCSA